MFRYNVGATAAKSRYFFLALTGTLPFVYAKNQRRVTTFLHDISILIISEGHKDEALVFSCTF